MGLGGPPLFLQATQLCKHGSLEKKGQKGSQDQPRGSVLEFVERGLPQPSGLSNPWVPGADMLLQRVDPTQSGPGLGWEGGVGRCSDVVCGGCWRRSRGSQSSLSSQSFPLPLVQLLCRDCWVGIGRTTADCLPFEHSRVRLLVSSQNSKSLPTSLFGPPPPSPGSPQ